MISKVNQRHETFDMHHLTVISPVYHEQMFISALITTIQVSTVQRVDKRKVTMIGSRTQHSEVTPEEVSRKFHCSLETAKKTLDRTTQVGVRHALHPLHRRYRVDHLDLNRKRLNGIWHMDTLFSRVKSLNNNTCANVFTDGYYTRVFPLPNKSSESVSSSLTDFADDVGIPDTLVCDQATEYIGPHTLFQKEVRQLKIRTRYAKKGRSVTQNHRAVVEIREIKKQWKTRMLRKGIPKALWDYGLVYIAEIQLLITRGSEEVPGLERVLGQTIDISECLDFEFYDLVWSWDERKWI